MWFGCCSNKEELQKERAGENEQDDVQAADDLPVKPLPVAAPIRAADAAGGPGDVGAPKIAVKRLSAEKAAAEEAEVERAKQLAQQQATHKAELMREGETAFGRRDWAAAVSTYSDAIEFDPGFGSAWVGRGGAHLRQGQYEDALKDLNQALDLESENLFALRDRAEARFKTGDLDGASEDFNKKLSLAPGDGRALCGRGEVKLKKGDRHGALSDFQLAMRLNYPGASEMFRSAKAEN